jgi:hypothetical protein
MGFPSAASMFAALGPMALAVTASAGMVGAFVAAPPASAAGVQTRLTVKVKHASGKAKAAWLTCAPAGGSHRRAAEACTALTAAGGDPGKIPATDGFCTMEYAPVTLKVNGRWKGRAVKFQQKFSNTCGMYLQTGAIAQP